jgi:hypothetical protein
VGRASPVVFVLLMPAKQIASLVGPLPSLPATVARSGLGAYAVCAAMAGWIDGKQAPVASG